MSETVLITGGSRGIGAACVELFAKNGYNVAFIYQNSDEKAAKIAQATGALAVKADVSCLEQVERAFAQVESAFGGVDVLVNNAGISRIAMLCDTTEEDWDRLFAVNAKSTFLCSKRAMGHMVHQKRGAIVNVSSMWGQTGGSCEVAYSASKAAVIGFTKALAKELGPSGIRVNCIAPGVIDTEMNAQLSLEDREALAEETPLCRLGTPMEAARAIFFLASDAASFITGQVLAPNGGIVI